MSIPTDPPTKAQGKRLEEFCIRCPHVTAKTVTCAEAIIEGALIHISYDSPLLLCPQCWQIVKAHVMEQLIKDALQRAGPALSPPK